MSQHYVWNNGLSRKLKQKLLEVKWLNKKGPQTQQFSIKELFQLNIQIDSKEQ